jgi:hypothetical protein
MASSPLLEGGDRLGLIRADGECLGAKDVVELHIAGVLVLVLDRWHCVSRAQRYVEPETSRGGRSLAHVVGLDAADGNKGVCSLGDGVGQHVLELTDFVAAKGQA